MSGQIKYHILLSLSPSSTQRVVFCMVPWASLTSKHTECDFDTTSCSPSSKTNDLLESENAHRKMNVTALYSSVIHALKCSNIYGYQYYLFCSILFIPVK